MTRRKKTNVMKKIDGYETQSFDFPANHWIENLEAFYEENEVGMESISRWKDVTVEDVDIYGTKMWLDAEIISLGHWKIVDGTEKQKTFSFKGIESHQLAASLMSYQGQGALRYEIPQEGGAIDEKGTSLFFSNPANVGVFGRVTF